MKKICFFIIYILLAVLLLQDSVLAADYVARMQYNNLPQDALIVGEISNVDHQAGTMEIDVVRVVIGKVCKKHIVLQSIEETKKFIAGDSILLSADFTDSKLYECQVAHGCYKVDLKSDKKVKILFGPSEGLPESYVVELEWFVNTGRGTSSDAYGIYSYSSQDKKSELIYDTNKHKWFKNSLEKKYDAPDMYTQYRFKMVLIGLAGVVIICFVGWIIVKARKNR